MPSLSWKRSSGPPAASFKKVRADHSMETAEDYVEAVSDILHRQGQCRVKDLAAHMGVSHVTVTRVIARLQDESLVSTEPYRPIRLTAEGEKLAAAARRRPHSPGRPRQGRSRRLVQQVGWHVRSFQGDEVAGVWHLSEFGDGEELLVGLSV